MLEYLRETGLSYSAEFGKDSMAFESTNNGEYASSGDREMLSESRSLIITKKMTPLHPGEVLLEEFMIPLEISQNKLGQELGVSPRRINEMVHGKRRVTADTALRLSIYFGNTPDFWLGLQMDYDLDREIDLKWDQIKSEVHRFHAV